MSHLLQVNLSQWTKNRDTDILSGSFVVSGNCLAEVIHVGADNYTG